MPGQRQRPELLKREHYPHWLKDELRYSDTDRQGHVNNAVYVTFLESARVNLFYLGKKRIAPEGTSLVVAHLSIDYLAEILWPNEVAIGTAIARLGKSSMNFEQGIFVNDVCVAAAETIIVLVDSLSHKPKPLSEPLRLDLKPWLARAP
jgi:acyl-CoA thioester hydrolase